jgi:hypothetical protein
VELLDETRPGADVWAAAGEDTLKGNFLRILKAGTTRRAERMREGK